MTKLEELQAAVDAALNAREVAYATRDDRSACDIASDAYSVARADLDAHKKELAKNAD